uniref:DUF2726 domain-containing protein n=1 Tax=Escherichia coli TaxID=562 RepID=UPI0021C0BBEC
NHTDCPLTDFGGKTSIFSHPVYLFLRKFSLQDSRGGSSRQWWQLFRMVSQWHVDVVIVERRSFSIVAAVELDDASHLRPERRRRDILLEEVLRQAGIPLLRSHDARKLLQMTGEWLNTTGADQQSPEHRS